MKDNVTARCSWSCPAIHRVSLLRRRSAGRRATNACRYLRGYLYAFGAGLCVTTWPLDAVRRLKVFYSSSVIVVSVHSRAPILPPNGRRREQHNKKMVFANTVRVTSIITGGGGGLQNPSEGLVQFMFLTLAWYGLW